MIQTQLQVYLFNQGPKYKPNEIFILNFYIFISSFYQHLGPIVLSTFSSLLYLPYHASSERSYC